MARQDQHDDKRDDGREARQIVPAQRDVLANHQHRDGEDGQAGEQGQGAVAFGVQLKSP